MSFPVFTANVSIIVILAVAGGMWLFWRYRFMRGMKKGDKIPKHDLLMLILMLFFGWSIFQHLAMHGYFFTCQFAKCISTATMPLIRYAIVFGLQPIVSRLCQRPYRKRDYQAWLVAGLGFLLICSMAGKIAGISVMHYRQRGISLEQRAFDISRSKNGLASYSTPGLSNGYDYIRQAKSSFHDLSREFSDSPLEYGAKNLSEFNDAWKTIDIGRLEKELANLQPAFDALQKAAAADYYFCYENDRREAVKSLMLLRGAAHALAMRARLRMYKQRTPEALADIDTILRFAAMLQNDRIATMDGIMIATAIRGTGLNLAAEFFRYYRSDAALLEQLRLTLERDAAIIRVKFPMERIPQTDHVGHLPIALDNPDDRSATRSALARYYYKWAQFDSLLIAISLEAYHHDNNRYPERLDELFPKCMAKIPREPYYGKPYGYRIVGNDFQLSWENMHTSPQDSY